jgi:hypothetical protein
MKRSWKKSCHHQLHMTFRSSRAAAPVDANFMNARPIDNGYDSISIFVVTPRFWAVEAKVSGCIIFIAIASLKLFFIVILR